MMKIDDTLHYILYISLINIPLSIRYPLCRLIIYGQIWHIAGMIEHAKQRPAHAWTSAAVASDWLTKSKEILIS